MHILKAVPSKSSPLPISFLFSLEGSILMNVLNFRRLRLERSRFLAVAEFHGPLRNDHIAKCVFTDQVASVSLRAWGSTFVIHTMACDALDPGEWPDPVGLARAWRVLVTVILRAR